MSVAQYANIAPVANPSPISSHRGEFSHRKPIHRAPTKSQAFIQGQGPSGRSSFALWSIIGGSIMRLKMIAGRRSVNDAPIPLEAELSVSFDYNAIFFDDLRWVGHLQLVEKFRDTRDTLVLQGIRYRPIIYAGNRANILVAAYQN